MSDATILEPREAYALWAADYPPHAHNPVMRAEEGAMRALLPADLTGRRVLDIGCGSGRYLTICAERGAAEIAGVDLSRPMLRNAHPVAPVVQGDLLKLPIRSAWADVVVSGLAIGHVPDLAGALLEMRRVARAGALILVSDVHPIGAEMGWRREFKNGGHRYAVSHTIHSTVDWHDACAVAGLCIDAVTQPRIDRKDIPDGAHFDPRALDIPVVVVYALRPAVISLLPVRRAGDEGPIFTLAKPPQARRT